MCSNFPLEKFYKTFLKDAEYIYLKNMKCTNTNPSFSTKEKSPRTGYYYGKTNFSLVHNHSILEIPTSVSLI